LLAEQFPDRAKGAQEQRAVQCRDYRRLNPMANPIRPPKIAGPATHEIRIFFQARHGDLPLRSAVARK